MLSKMGLTVWSLGKKHTKTHESREIPLHPLLVEELKAAVRRGPRVVGSVNGHTRDFRGIIERCIEKTKIPHFRWHDLRHSFATNLRRAGVSLEDIAVLLGHKDIHTTLIYAHSDLTSLARCVERLAGPPPSSTAAAIASCSEAPSATAGQRSAATMTPTEAAPPATLASAGTTPSPSVSPTKTGDGTSVASADQTEATSAAIPAPPSVPPPPEAESS
ncbi:MAG: tyrosine-type recombinase/integrase [Candidatus Riflebacteria bacterium]|nr:tyrosine-type recombinase/integrase [Candidatus Riflebacteria bacterium]